MVLRHVLLMKRMDTIKSNYIVSVYPNTWIEGAKRLFLAEPYVHHVLEKNDELKNYESVEVAPFIRESKEDLIDDNNFVDKKYNKYVPILANRLNKIHATSHDIFFWKKCLALGLLRNITLVYDVYKMCENNFNEKDHDCKTISEKSYFIPKDYNEQRNFFQSTAYGQEQIFSIYVHHVYPGKYQVVNDEFSWPTLQSKKIETNKLIQIIKRLSRATPSKIVEKIKKHVFEQRQPVVGIVESFFSAEHLKDLTNKGRGLIRTFEIDSSFTVSNEIDWDKRQEISIADDSFDDFDELFFKSLKYCLPTIFLEDFKSVYFHYTDSFRNISDLKCVVNESWIGNNYSAILLAVLQQKGIKHIYNEHNFLSHHFLANNHKYIFPLVDEFITLGWYKDNVPKLIKGATLFEWVKDKNCVKEHDLLFISGQPAVKAPEISASYGDFGGFNAYSHLAFNKKFFDSLKESTINSMVYRGYPLDSYVIAHINPPMFAYDQEYILKEYIHKVKFIDNVSRSAKLLMQKSKLVIIDYLSTSYIESMMANIPTIFFWNRDIFPLGDEYSDFYEGLISVGICQTNPIEAAKFVEQIIALPDEWWEKSDVQDAKNEFLSKNFGRIDVLKKILLDKCTAQ